MKTDYDFLIDSLSPVQRDVVNSLQPNPLEPLKEEPQVFEANKEIGDAAIEFVGECVLNTPFAARTALERLGRSVDDIKKTGTDYVASKAAATEFKTRFSVETLRESKAKSKRKDESAPKSQLESDAIAIARQSLFLSFFKMLQPKRRKRLIEMLEAQTLCDKETLDELRTRINEKIEDDKLKFEALLRQVEKGGMDCFLWLHGMLFEFFNKAMELEERNAELIAQIDKEKKLMAETQTGPPKANANHTGALAKTGTKCGSERENASQEKTSSDAEREFA